eukprot:10696894-Alexandrium_andersonii.AAC.1
MHFTATAAAEAAAEAIANPAHQPTCARYPALLKHPLGPDCIGPTIAGTVPSQAGVAIDGSGPCTEQATRLQLSAQHQEKTDKPSPSPMGAAQLSHQLLFSIAER